MKWSWKMGTFAGIDVLIHATFLLIIGWVGFNYWQQTSTLAGTLEGILFTLLLFGFVVLHEYEHALTAWRYGIKIRDITLYPIGGVARKNRSRNYGLRWQAQRSTFSSPRYYLGG